MLRSNYRHSYRIRTGPIRYPRSRLSYRQMMMRRPAFYRKPVPRKQPGLFDFILAMLAALFCLNRRQPRRPAISSGVGGITSGGSGGITLGTFPTVGGGLPTAGNSSSCGGGSCGGGGGGGNCGGGSGGGSCGGSGGGGGSCGGGGGGSCGGGSGGSCGGGD